jgi:xylitol oxidase
MQNHNIVTNWSENVKYSAKNIFYPTNEDELRMLVLQIKSGKALGSRHSFNNVADTNDTLISTEKLNKVISIDENKSLIWVESGIKYGELGIYLEKKGYALQNLASLPHISVGGAISTATHGSGDANGNLSSQVEALEILGSDGNVIKLDKTNSDFFGAVVALGALGIVTKIALSIQPSYQVTQELFENLPMSELESNFDEIYKSGYSVSMFTNWLGKKIDQIWVKKRVENDKPFKSIEYFFGATPAKENLHPIKSNSAINCTEQMGVPGKWYERLPHFKIGFTPSNGSELQSEFFVPRKHAFKAIMEVESLHELIFPCLLITEIRSIAADELWLSPAYKQDIVSIHFTWKQDNKKVMQIISKIEEKLRPFDFIPHWGKLFTISGLELKSRYPKLKDFINLAKRMDPEGKWKNDFLNRTIYA